MKNILWLFGTLMIALLAQGTEPVAPKLPPPVTLEGFKLVGELSGDRAEFVLTAMAKVENSKGAFLELLSGPVALTDIGAHKQWHVRAESNKYFVDFEHGGKFPIQIKFNAAVRRREAWSWVDFRIAPS